jgi:serine phosphatase RsbU (regulator of sigma subunit)
MLHSIVFKILSIIIVLLFLVFSAIGWDIYNSQNTIISDLQKYQKEYIIEQLDRAESAEINREMFTLKKLTLSILGAVTQSLYNMDDTSIQTTLSEFMQNENIKAVQIFDTLLGKTFINAYNDSNNDDAIIINITDELPTKFTQLEFIENNLVNNDDVIGRIKVYYNNDSIYESISKMKKIDLYNFNSQASLVSESLNVLIIKQVIIFIVGVCLIAITIIHLLIKFVNNPLKKLNQGLNDFFLFLQGEKNAIGDIDIYSNDEFGEMASSLNENIEVSAKLHENIRELNTSLEKKVQLRTQELAEINNQVQESIDYASTIQRSFLKDPHIINKKFNEFFVIWQPRDIVGGDLYIYEESHLGFLFGVVDCTGHSVPGGFMTMLAGCIIKRLSDDYFTNPAKILGELNIAIKHQLNQDVDDSLSDDGLDMGLCFINKEKNRLVFSGAKIDLIYFTNNNLNMVKSNTQSIGYRKSKKDYEYINHEISIDSSESFYLYSDGITDQTGGDKSYPYSKKRFRNLLSSIQDKPLTEQRSLILDNLEQYQNSDNRKDDITVLGFKV